MITARESVLGRVGVGCRLTVIGAACALVAAVSPVPTADARPLVTGITYLDSYDSVTLQQTKAAGAQLVRIIVPWWIIAPSHEPSSWNPEDPQDPSYDWAGTDLAVTRVVEAGFTPMLLLDGAPPWVQRCQPPAAVPGALCDPDPAALAAFATASARRYSGYFAGLPRVRYWQGLNEANLGIFFQPQFVQGKPVSPTLYRRLVNAFYFAVKSVNRSNLVLAAGLGPIAIPHWTIGPMRFTRELLCMTGGRNPQPTSGNCGGGVHFDIFDIHPYTTGGPTHKGKVDDVQLGDLAKLKELLAAADRAGRIKGRFRRTPLWNTEFSWDSKPPDPGGLPMRILTRWTAEALYRGWSAGISRFFWLSLRDFPPSLKLPFSETLESGLYFRGATVAEDRPKPNMYAFRFPFVAYSAKDGFTFWGRTPDSRGGPVLIQIRQGGGWRNVAVARADRHGIFEGAVETAYGRNKRGTVRARYRKETAIPFSLRPVKDFYQPPFGKPVG